MGVDFWKAADWKKQHDEFEVDLTFMLGEEETFVYSNISVYPRVEGCVSPLVLNGDDLKLLSVKVNGKELKEVDFQLDSHHLILPSPPRSKFVLEIVTEICPQKNTSLNMHLLLPFQFTSVCWRRYRRFGVNSEAEFEGCFKVSNVKTEKELICQWFTHKQELKPGINVTYNEGYGN